MPSTTEVTLELAKPEKSNVLEPKPNRGCPATIVLAFAAMVVGISSLAVGLVALSRAQAIEARLQPLEVDADTVKVTANATPPVGYSGTSTSLLAGSGSWAPNAQMPSERSDLQTISCGGVIVVLGGLDLANNVMSTVFTFDVVSETYNASKAPMPTPRYRFGAACVGNTQIYVAGGFADTTTGNTGQSLGTVDIYDMARDSWSAGPPLNEPRGDLALVAAADGSVHAIGGYDWSYNAMATNERLPPGGTAWANGAPMPHPKGDVQAARIGDVIYVPGGWNADRTFLNDLLAYDLVAGTWSSKAPMSFPRGDMAVAALNGKLYVIGGEMWSGRTSTCDWGWGPIECAVNLIPMHSVEMYSPDDDTWTEMAPLPSSRFRFAAAAANGRGGTSEGAIIAFGGHAHGEVAVRESWGFHDVPRPNLYLHTRA